MLLKMFFWPLLYGLLVQGPLFILNALYQAFCWLCGINVGEAIFGSTNGFNFNWDNPLMKFLVVSLIIAIVLFGIAFIVVAIQQTTSRKGEQIVWLGKFKWIIMAIMSIFLIPTCVILMTSLASALFWLITPSAMTFTMLESEFTSAINIIESGLNEINSSLNGDTSSIVITITALDSSDVIMSLKESIVLLQRSILAISEEANQAGINDVVISCNEAINNLVNFSMYLDELDETIIGINNILEYKIQYENGNVKVLDQKTMDELNTYVYTLTSMQMCWNSAIENVNEILRYQTILASGATAELNGSTFDAWLILDNFAKVSMSNGEYINTSHWYVVNQIFYDIGSDSNKCGLFTGLMKGTFDGKAESSFSLKQLSSDGINSEVIATINFTTSSVIGLVSCMNALNPASSNSFSLVIMIYQLATGRSDTNWMSLHWLSNFSTSWTELACAGIAAWGAMIIMALFCLFAARRLVELIIYSVSSIWFCAIGFIDDGVRYYTLLKVIVGKTFSVVCVMLSFQVGLLVGDLLMDASETMANGMGSLATTILQCTIMLATLLGGYFGGNWLAQQIGDNNTPSQTLAQMGVLKSAGRAVAGATVFAKNRANQKVSDIKSGAQGKIDKRNEKFNELKQEKMMDSGILKTKNVVDSKTGNVSTKYSVNKKDMETYSDVMNMNRVQFGKWCIDNQTAE